MHIYVYMYQSVSSVAQSCPTLCNAMDCSTPGFPVRHQLPKLAQAHVHQVGDAIQPSHPLSSLCNLLCEEELIELSSKIHVRVKGERK